DGPGAILLVKRLTHGNEQVAGQTGMDTGFGHRHVLHRVQALLRTQRGDPAVIAVHVNDALIGDPVRALPVGGALEHEAVATQFQTVAWLHAQVTLAVEQTCTDHTDRTYRDADMGHDHAPVTARQCPDRKSTRLNSSHVKSSYA